MFFHVYKKHYKTCITNIKLQMFRHYYTCKEYLTQMIKNKNLPFVKTKNRNVLNVQVKNS